MRILLSAMVCTGVLYAEGLGTLIERLQNNDSLQSAIFDEQKSGVQKDSTLAAYSPKLEAIGTYHKKPRGEAPGARVGEARSRAHAPRRGGRARGGLRRVGPRRPARRVLPRLSGPLRTGCAPRGSPTSLARCRARWPRCPGGRPRSSPRARSSGTPAR